MRGMTDLSTSRGWLRGSARPSHPVSRSPWTLALAGRERPWAIISAGLAPILLTGAYLIAGLLQPASYSPVHTTISAMAGQAGTDRWVMTVLRP